MPPLFTTVDELKAHLGSQVSGDPGDLFESVLEAAETQAGRSTGRILYPQPGNEIPITKTAKIRDPEQRIVRVPDVRKVTSISLDGAALSADDYDLLASDTSENPATHLELFEVFGLTALNPIATLSITGLFGFNPTPPDIREAVLQHAARIYHSRDARFGDAVATPEGTVFDMARSMPEYSRVVYQSYRVLRIGLLSTS